MGDIMWFSRVIIVFVMCLVMCLASIMLIFELIELGDLLILLMLFNGFLAVIFHLEDKK